MIFSIELKGKGESEIAPSNGLQILFRSPPMPLYQIKGRLKSDSVSSKHFDHLLKQIVFQMKQLDQSTSLSPNTLNYGTLTQNCLPLKN